MLIEDRIRKSFPQFSARFGELEEDYAHCEERFVFRTISKAGESGRIGANAVKYLLSIFLRAKSLLEGFALCLNNESVLSSYLIVRSHYETTGASAYFLRELSRFADGKYSKGQLSDSIRRMILGSRRFPLKTGPNHSRYPEIPNVLNYIDEVDNVLTNILSKPPRTPFRDNYDFLSEFCHPNAYGLFLGSRILRGRVVEHERHSKLTEKHLGILLSSALFPVLYDRSWDLARSNFELPELER
jgi:hypothetical protein